MSGLKNVDRKREPDGQWELADARTIFLSDVHLGSRFCRAETLVDLLSNCLPQKLYIVGDLFDQRRLRRGIKWKPEYTALLDQIYSLSRSGTEVYYTPGNHDTFLRRYAEDFRLLEIRDSFVHQCVDDKRLVILHGDQFDCVERRLKWLSELGSFAYESLLVIDRSLNAVLGLVSPIRIPLSRGLKQFAKKIVQKKSDFRQQVTDRARSEGCEGIVCGHIHHPEIAQIDEILYCNTGDWIEHTSAIVEWPDGRLQLIDASQFGTLGGKQARFRRVSSSRESSQRTQPIGKTDAAIGETSGQPRS